MFEDFYPNLFNDDDDDDENLPITPDQQAYTVAGITHYIADLIDRDALLQSVSVQGEVSNMTAARSGHWYFTIKDANAALKCVMFKGATSKQSFQPVEGDDVIVTGNIGVYENRGEYQLYATRITPLGGSGDLYRRFEELKQKLAAEGLFDPERKRPIPVMPATIGIVTSANAAALRDMRHVIARRYPLANVILSPTLVQGATAPAQIISALERLYTHTPTPDVIIVARGGGSIEDLWSFNDEEVARTIVASPIPIISGIGHEVDFTIADFVADERAPTPSSAAERATPDQTELMSQLLASQQYLFRSLQTTIEDHRTQLHFLRKSLGYRSPRQRIDNARQQTDEWLSRIQDAQSRYYMRLHERLQIRLHALETASPKSILARGYAIVQRTADNQIVRRRADAPAGTAITIITHEEEIKARTEDEETHDQYKRTLF